MKNVELLAPAGDQESLVAAIQNGADAIYLGGTLFNARAFAKNFDKEQLKWAVEYAHLRNVKIFVTVNTLFKDDEFEELLNYIEYLYSIQIDALIIQDIGLFDLVRKKFPDFEIHISTQASIFNKCGAKFFEKRGAKRIVLARENSIEEIKQICDSTSLDVEVFVHGAMCISYSGQCLMSSFIGKRSGNRGQCAQPCRLNYKLIKDNQIINNNIPFILSPKDLMTIENIGDLIDAGVYSFKIEGRMKKPEYVASVVKAYKKAIDSHLNKTKIQLSEEIYDMKSMFNRNYTNGYIFNDKYIVEGDYSGNKGVIIGKVLSYHKKTKRVSIELNDSLKQEDSIVFESIDKGRPVNKIYYQNRLVSCGKKGDIIEIEFDYPVYKGNVRKTINVDVITKMQETYNKDYRKEKVYMKFIGRYNQKAQLTLIYKDIILTKESDSKCEKALNKPLDKERIYQQLSKLGQTTFIAEKIEIDIDENITLPIKELNQLRRNVIEELNEILSHKQIHTQKEDYQVHYVKQIASKHETHILVTTLEQLNTVLNYPIDYIYYPYQSNALEAYDICKNRNKEMILFIPRICKDKDIDEILDSEIYKKVKSIVVNDYGTYEVFKDKQKIIGTGLNVYNQHSVNHYSEDKILSLEMSLKEIKALNTDYNKCIMQIYGKIENMISEYCPISQHYFSYQKKKCQICKSGAFALIDRKNEKFDLMMDEKCRMHLLNSKALYIDQINHIPTKGLLLHFTNELIEDIDIILEDYFLLLNNKKRKLNKENFNWTYGYFKA